MAKGKRRRSNRKLARTLRQDLRTASRLADNQLDTSSLSRVDASRTQDVANLLNQYQATSDPFSSAYAGRRSGQLKDFLSRYEASTQGYDNQELNALREQRRRGLERGFQSGRAGLARSQGNYRLGATQRAAQMADLARSYGQQSADAENDLFIQSEAEKQRRLEGYGSAVQDVEGTEFERGDKALANYRDALETARANELEREKINLGQESADRLAKESGKLGMLGIIESRRNARRQNKLIREGYRSNERIAGSNNSSQNAYADALSELANRYTPQ